MMRKQNHSYAHSKAATTPLSLWWSRRPSGDWRRFGCNPPTTRGAGIENEVVDGAETLDVLPGLIVPVASLGHLIAIKLLSRDDRDRPQDIVDLRALVKRATEDELERAHDAVCLVEARGFQRGRDLVSSLEELIKEERDS